MKLVGSTALKIGLFCLILVMAAPAALDGASLSLSASPDNVVFLYSPPEATPSPVFVTVTASDGSKPVITVTVTPATGTPATLFPQPPVSGDVFQVGIDPNTLNTLLSQPPASYRATITVTASGFPALMIPVTLSINTQVSITPTPISLSFTAPTGPTVQTVSLTGNSVANVSFTFAVSTLTGGSWLTVTSSADFTPATLTVTVNPLIVPSGTYSGAITITPAAPGEPFSIPVTLVVGTNSFVATPTSFAFAYTQGSTLPPAQLLQLSSPATNDTFTAQTSTTDGGDWLLINGVSSNVSGALPASLNVTVNPAGLSTGTYTGTITAADANNNIDVIAVTLVVTGLSGVANPPALVFLAQVGGAAPSPQTVVIQGFGAASYTAQVDGSWLSVSSTAGNAPAQINVSANPAGLAAGTYSGSVTIDVDTHIQMIQVSFVVSANQVITTTPGDLIIGYFGGNLPPAPLILNVNVSSGMPVPFTFAPDIPSWLQISPDSNLSTPSTLTVTVAPQTLPTGIYLGQIILTPGVAGEPAATVPVLLTVSNAPAVTPNVTSLTFNGNSGGAPQNQNIGVTAPVAVSFTATTTTATGGNWLSVSPNQAVTTSESLPLTVTADPTSLAAGTYTGDVILTTAGGVVSQVAVTFVVAASNVQFSVSPSTLTFAYTENGVLPPSQVVQVTAAQAFTAAASTTSGGSWLAVTPNSGTQSASLTVSVNPLSLAVGTYTGVITVTPSSGAAQTVTVTLSVVTTATLGVTPNSLSFSYISGNPNPAPQTLSITSSGAAVALSAAASSSGWLSVTPSVATTPATLSVSVDPSSLGQGTYQGTIALTGNNGVLLYSVNVTLSVATQLPSLTAVVNAASYTGGAIAPGEIVVVFGTSLGPSTGVLAKIDNGFIDTTLTNVQVNFNGYFAPILYASATQINAIVPYELAGSSDATVEVVFGSGRSNTLTLPVVSSAPGVFSVGESGMGGGAILDENYHLVSASNPASPGSVIQIFATGQGQTSPAGVDGLIEPLTLPLPEPLGAPTVLIGGIQAVVQYAGAAPGLVAGALQVNAVVPAGVASGAVPLIVFIGPNSSQAGITVAVQ